MEKRKVELKLYLTRRCNFRCTYCYVPFKNEEAEPKVVDKIIELLTDDDTLSIFGGEPLLFSDMIIDILDRLDAKGSRSYIKIFSNGSFMNEPLMKKLKETERNVMLQISYDGTRQDHVHPMGGIKLTNVEDNIKRYVEEFQGTGCMRCSMSENKERTLHIETTVTPDTIDGIADGIQTMINLGIRSIGIVPVIEVDKWTEEDAQKYKVEFRRIKDMVLQTYRDGDSVFITHLSPFRSTNQDQYGCGAGKYLLALSPDGGLWTCHRYYAYAQEHPEEKDKYGYGNILDVTSLRELENSLDIPVPQKDLRCGTCEARQFCTKCHLANKLLNGDEFQAPVNGYCQLPFVHKEIYEEMQRDLMAEENPTFLRELYSVMSRPFEYDDSYDVPIIPNPTLSDVVTLAERLNAK